MAICFASGVKAQFYDSADDIYYYISYDETTNPGYLPNRWVYIFNFDGKKACWWGYGATKDYIVKVMKEKFMDKLL